MTSAPWYSSRLEYFANKLTRGALQWIFISQRDSAIWLQSVCNVPHESFGPGRAQLGAAGSSAGTALSGFCFGKPIIAMGQLRCRAVESQRGPLLESNAQFG